VLNPQFRSQRTKGEGEIPTTAVVFGSFDWLRRQAQAHPRFKRRVPRTQKQGFELMARVADFPLADGRRPGVV
jgi:hypothetical protein